MCLAHIKAVFHIFYKHIFIQKLPFLIPFTEYFNESHVLPPDHNAYLLPYQEQENKIKVFLFLVQ